ncbi:hypothetical protein H0H93_004984 [Arthromyces matolae]|nr:hypothetical protein H0H93_004984 [Arthromyces matolae]
MPASRASRKSNTQPSPSRKITHNAESVPSSREHSVEPTAASLLSQSKQTTDDWYKSARTKKGYATYVKSGKKLLADWSCEDIPDSNPNTMEHMDRTGLADAFDSISENTPIALRLLVAYKCEHLGRGFATAEGIRSAFKDYFERVHGCQGDGWKYNSYTKEWEGNPVFEQDFKAYYESLKNRDNQTGTSTQALPMLPKDLNIIMDYLDSEEAAQRFSVVKRLYFKAFATTSFMLWTRNDEMINLQIKHIKTATSELGEQYFRFELVFRKTNKDKTKGQVYHVPSDSEIPKIDCFKHLSLWIKHLQSLIARPLTGNDYIFPAIASTGRIKFGEATSRSGFESLMDDIIQESGVLRGRNGKFTTHCFRRGGAQWRFMWAKRKFSLKAVKWWGGWSSNENVGTIMRYLLDELMAYEEDFSDVLMSHRTSERHDAFMGIQDSESLVRHGDLQAFQASMMQNLETLIPQSIGPPTLHSTSSQQHLASPISQPTPSRRNQTPEPSPLTPQPRIPKTTSLDDVLSYWSEGAPAKGLTVPLKLWDVTYEDGDYGPTEAVKFSNIRFVRDEFVHHCKGDFDIFEERYPGLRRQYTKLVKAIRCSRQERGEAKSRHRKPR